MRNYQLALKWAREECRRAHDARSREAAQRRIERFDDEALNKQLEERLEDIDGLLTGYSRKGLVAIVANFKRALVLPTFDPAGFDEPSPVPRLDLTPLPNFWVRILLGQGRYKRAQESAQRRYAAALAERERVEKERLARLAARRSAHEDKRDKARHEVNVQHAAVDAFLLDLTAGVPEAVRQYYDIVLDQDELPDGFPHRHRVAYAAESKLLLVERDMPTVEAVPKVARYRYVKARRTIESSMRPASKIRSLYGALVARFALRTLSILASASPNNS